MKCKYVTKNGEQNKCHDYYISHAKNKTRYMCRLMEWKVKKKICPYDPTIFSTPRKIRKEVKDGKQKNLNIYNS